MARKGALFLCKWEGGTIQPGTTVMGHLVIAHACTNMNSKSGRNDSLLLMISRVSCKSGCLLRVHYMFHIFDFFHFSSLMYSSSEYDSILGAYEYFHPHHNSW